MKRLLILLLTICSILYSQNIDIKEEKLFYIGKYMSYLEDKNSLYSIQDVESLDFKPLNKNVHSQFFTQSSYWYKFTVLNYEINSKEKYFVFDLPWIDDIEIYVLNKNRIYTYQIGNKFNFLQRSKQTNILNQLHSFSNGVSTVFIKVKTRDPFVVPLSLLTKDEFENRLHLIHYLEFSIYTSIIVILLFNFILYFITKLKVYLYYVFFLLSFLLMSVSINNYSFILFLETNAQLQNWLQSFSIFTYSIFGILFAKSFLDLKNNHPFINSFINFILSIYILLLLSGFIISYHIHIQISIYLAIVFSIVTLSIAIYSFIKGNKSASFFIIGAFFGLVGTSITGLTVISFIPYDWYLYKAVDFGILIDCILLSVALANRYIVTLKQLEKTKEKLIILNADLEKKVENRTKELSIELSNKNVLLKEMSHRIKNNLQVISAFLSMDVNKIKDEKAQEVINKNINRIKSIAILYENFLESKDLKNINLSTYLNEIISSFRSSIVNKQIEFELEIEEFSISNDKLIPLSLVINELMTNSIKYAFKDVNEGEIDISLKLRDNEVILTYRDNGEVEVSDEKVKKGFGYKILRSLVNLQLNGSLSYTSKNGLLYTIIFTNE